MADVRTSSLKSPIAVGEYLFTRLRQIGVRSIHGVPGDFNLVALDYIPQVGLKWVGNCNELNAGRFSSGRPRHWQLLFVLAIPTTRGIVTLFS